MPSRDHLNAGRRALRPPAACNGACGHASNAQQRPARVSRVSQGHTQSPKGGPTGAPAESMISWLQNIPWA